MTGIKKLALYIALAVVTIISSCCAIYLAFNENDGNIAYAESSGGLALVTTSSTAATGSEFSVSVYVEENSNLAGCAFTLVFDSDIVSIVKDKCTSGDAGAVVNVTDSNVTVSYARAVSTNVKLDIATLVFKVNSGVTSGSYNSWLSLGGEKEFYDDSFNNITMTYSASVLTVSEVNVGDVYSDGNIDSKDAIYILQYLANMDSAKDINLANANTYVEDNSDDGTIKLNSKDAVLLMQYLAKMDVTMGVGEWSVQVAPTESSEGTLVRKTAAGIETVTLPALNSADYAMTVKSEATCIAHEILAYSYIQDGTTITFEVEGTTYGGHVSSDWVTVQAATCEKSGLKHKVCTLCGAELETETIDALGHDYGEWTVSVEPTLTSTGKLVKTCANDSNHIQTADLPALNQTDYVYTFVSAATCATEGKTTYSYSKDGQYFVFNVALEKLAHTEVADAAVAATCTESGLTAGSHCSVCGEVIVAQTVVPATGHNWETAECSNCGAIKDGYTAISNSTQLSNISSNMSGNYVLTSNISLSSGWSPIGYSTSTKFKGVFDGNNHTISGLASSNSAYGGLFWTNSGTIKNLKLASPSFTTYYYEDLKGSLPTYGDVTATFGGIASINNGTIESCSVTGAITVSTYNYIGLWFDSISNGTDQRHDFYNTYYLGGIVGINNGTVSGCEVSADFSYSSTNYMGSGFGILGGIELGGLYLHSNVSVGGMIGVNNGSLTDSTMTGDCTLNSTQTAHSWKGSYQSRTVGVEFKCNFGSLVGNNTSIISDCYGTKCQINTDHTTQGTTSKASLDIEIKNSVLSGIIGYSSGTVSGSGLN